MRRSARIASLAPRLHPQLFKLSRGGGGGAWSCVVVCRIGVAQLRKLKMAEGPDPSASTRSAAGT